MGQAVEDRSGSAIIISIASVVVLHFVITVHQMLDTHIVDW